MFELIRCMLKWIGIVGVIVGVVAVFIFGGIALSSYAQKDFIGALLIIITVGGAVIGAFKYCIDKMFPDNPKEEK